MNTTPDTQQDEALDELVAAVHEYFDFRDLATEEAIEDVIAPHVAAIRRQAAADALREQARALGKVAQFYRQQAAAVHAKGRERDAETYSTRADQAVSDSNKLRREAEGIIQSGYEFTCAAGWDQCETRVPDAGDLCKQHDVDEEDRWAE